MPQLTTFVSAGRRILPNQWDLIAFAAILAVLTGIAKSYHGLSAPLPAANGLPAFPNFDATVNPQLQTNLIFPVPCEFISPNLPKLLSYFYFSIETLATVGYGDMHPATDYGHLVATVEIFTGMCFLAVMTGLIFARFSRPRASGIARRERCRWRAGGRCKIAWR